MRNYKLCVCAMELLKVSVNGTYVGKFDSDGAENLREILAASPDEYDVRENEVEESGGWDCFDVGSGMIEFLDELASAYVIEGYDIEPAFTSHMFIEQLTMEQKVELYNEEYSDAMIFYVNDDSINDVFYNMSPYAIFQAIGGINPLDYKFGTYDYKFFTTVDDEDCPFTDWDLETYLDRSIGDDPEELECKFEALTGYEPDVDD